MVVSGESGTLQCLEGTSNQQCLTGVRALQADSRSRLARLLDGVPGPATPPLTSTTSDPAHSENTTSQIYAENGPVLVTGDAKSPLVPWEWVASPPESLSQGWNSWTHSNSGLLLTLVSVIGSLLWFNRKASPGGHDAIAGMSGGSAFGKLVHKTPADGNTLSIAPGRYRRWDRYGPVRIASDTPQKHYFCSQLSGDALKYAAFGDRC